MASLKLSENDWLKVWLLSVDGVGPKLFARLLKKFETFEAVWNANLNDFARIERLSETTAKRIISSKASFSRGKLLDLMEEFSVRPIFQDSSEYPPRLFDYKRVDMLPPPLLWVRGDAGLLKSYPQACVVGTRKSNRIGERNTQEFVQALVSNDVTILSGLAYGIDSAAHLEALRVKGNTIGVLGSGILHAAKSRTDRAFQEVWARGVVVSPFSLFAKARSGTFPVRNRIMAAMADAVLVVQAPKDSGALITAERANEFGRPVFALPGEFNWERSFGCHNLINEKKAIIPICTGEIVDAVCRTAKRESLSKKEAKILEAIDSGKSSVDEISAYMAQSGLGGDIMPLLGKLELDGIIRREQGRYRFVALAKQ